MDLNYYKRYRMEIDLFGRDLSSRPIPRGYRILPWDESLLEAFALAKFNSFRGEIDANVFPCLGDLNGCRRLMSDIVRKPGFLRESAWLAVYSSEVCSSLTIAAQFKAFAINRTWAPIQNLGVTPEHRDLGRLSPADTQPEGFRGRHSSGYLEVTAQNTGAIRFITAELVKSKRCIKRLRRLVRHNCLKRDQWCALYIH
jgi:hypothetical protein